MKTLRFLPIVVLSGAWIGCGDPLKDAQNIQELRVLGAQAEVEGEPERATPEAGESASVTWLVADPGGAAPETVWSLSVCVAVDTNYGVLRCRDEPFATAGQNTLDTATPSIDFVVPDQETLGDAESLAVLGVVCDGGNADMDAFGEAGCGKGHVTQRVSLEVFLGGGDATNHNPDLSTTELYLDDSLWSEGSDCGSSDALVLPADGASHALRLEVGEDAREHQTRMLDEVDLESLQISHFATAGSLERRFSYVAPDSQDFTQQVSWSAPKQIDTTDQVSFFFVVRDERGGVSWLTRTVCLEP